MAVLCGDTGSRWGLGVAVVTAGRCPRKGERSRPLMPAAAGRTGRGTSYAARTGRVTLKSQ